MTAEDVQNSLSTEVRAPGAGHGWNTRTSDALLVVCVLAGVGIVVLSFMTWMDITFVEELGEDILTVVTHPTGTESNGLTTFGDGYLTAALGALAVALAIAYRLAGRWSFYCAGGLAVAGLIAAAIGLYNLAYNRADSGGGAFGISVQVEVSRAPALWGLTALGLLLTVASFALLSIAWRNVGPARDEGEPE